MTTNHGLFGDPVPRGIRFFPPPKEGHPLHPARAWRTPPHQARGKRGFEPGEYASEPRHPGKSQTRRKSQTNKQGTHTLASHISIPTMVSAPTSPVKGLKSFGKENAVSQKISRRHSLAPAVPQRGILKAFSVNTPVLRREKGLFRGNPTVGPHNLAKANETKRRVSFAPEVTLHKIELLPQAAAPFEPRRRESFAPFPSLQNTVDDSGQEALPDSSDDEAEVAMPFKPNQAKGERPRTSMVPCSPQDDDSDMSMDLTGTVKPTLLHQLAAAEASDSDPEADMELTQPMGSRPLPSLSLADETQLSMAMELTQMGTPDASSPEHTQRSVTMEMTTMFRFSREVTGRATPVNEDKITTEGESVTQPEDAFTSSFFPALAPLLSSQISELSQGAESFQALAEWAPRNQLTDIAEESDGVTSSSLSAGMVPPLPNTTHTAPATPSDHPHFLATETLKRRRSVSPEPSRGVAEVERESPRKRRRLSLSQSLVDPPAVTVLAHAAPATPFRERSSSDLLKRIGSLSPRKTKLQVQPQLQAQPQPQLQAQPQPQLQPQLQAQPEPQPEREVQPHPQSQLQPQGQPQGHLSFTPLRMSAPQPATSAVLDADISAGSIDTSSGSIDVYQPASLSQFMEAIEIKFYDDLLINDKAKRRSLMPRPAMPPATAGDYLRAKQKLPLLELYDFSSRELRKNITESHLLFQQLEAETAEENPPLLREYFQSSQAIRSNMNIQFQLIKDYARYQARGGWYGWRSQLVEGVLLAMKENGELLEDDRRVLAGVRLTCLQLMEDAKQERETQRARLAEVRAAKRQYESLQKENLHGYREHLGKVKRELEKQTAELAHIRRNLEDVTTATEATHREVIEAHELLTQSQTVLGSIKKFDHGELVALQLRFADLQHQTRTTFVAIKETTLTVLFDKSVEVSMDFARHEMGVSATSAPTTLISASPCVAPLVGHFTPLLLRPEGSVLDQYHNFTKAWHTLNQLNRDFTLLGLFFPIRYTPKGSSMEALIRFFSPQRGLKATMTVMVSLSEGRTECLLTSSIKVHRQRDPQIPVGPKVLMDRFREECEGLQLLEHMSAGTVSLA